MTQSSIRSPVEALGLFSAPLGPSGSSLPLGLRLMIATGWALPIPGLRTRRKVRGRPGDACRRLFPKILFSTAGTDMKKRLVYSSTACSNVAGMIPFSPVSAGFALHLSRSSLTCFSPASSRSPQNPRCPALKSRPLPGRTSGTECCSGAAAGV